MLDVPCLRCRVEGFAVTNEAKQAAADEIHNYHDLITHGRISPKKPQGYYVQQAIDAATAKLQKSLDGTMKAYLAVIDKNAKLREGIKRATELMQQANNRDARQ